jgi:hypothetical protein
MKEATVYANEIAQQENALAGIKASGKTEVYYLTPQEKEQWRQALLSVHTTMASRVGKDLVAIHDEASAEGYDPPERRRQGRAMRSLAGHDCSATDLYTTGNCRIPVSAAAGSSL